MAPSRVLAGLRPPDRDGRRGGAATLVATAWRYVPGARVIVVPGRARSSAFCSVRNGVAALVPLSVSEPVGETK